ncbi:RadC family protein [Streptosporangium canum]|uniref:DNA replication and repair protein RadC n=1 Tax=Streptosporangium canum TaxID=324952 RepID=A0A1I3UG84_9ACTN|nr:DNA repair protein RadC [Streptosporangium canum]SFJ80876.1 DNA replication and repair protein RadC [Streptosporangium canum]
MRVKDMPPNDQPRERLLSSGATALADRELLALLIGSGSRGANAVELASHLIAHCGDLRGLARSDAHRLMSVPGIGPAKAARVVAAFHLVRQAQSEPERRRITCSGDLAAVASPLLRGLSHERVVVVVCDPAGAVTRKTIVSEGGSDHAPAPVREIITTVLTSGGSSFGLAHNHPSGSLDPSPADLEVTARLGEAAETVGLRLLDHVIVTDTAWRRIAA